MSNKYNRYLTTDPTGRKGVLGNFQHATDVFVENFYRLAPRYKFLFYAFFEIDNTIPTTAKLINNRNDLELPLLVKTTSLPSFNYDTVTKNRYNRKKIVYKQINYEPIQFAFHDDSAGITNALWNSYNEYFSNDMLHANSYDWTTDNRTWSGKKYGMDTLNSVRFFKRITLYTMSRQKFNSYTLWGPRIKSWKHSDLDYADGTGILENTMGIEYEGVSYGSGDVTDGSPDGFAKIHYDHIRSPLDTAGGGNSNQVFQPPPEPNLTEEEPDFTANYQRAQLENRLLPLPTVDARTGQVLTDTSQVTNPNVVGGVVGAAFPSTLAAEDSPEGQAKPKVMNQNNTGSGFTAPVYEDAILRQLRDGRELERQRLARSQAAALGAEGSQEDF